MAQTIDVNCGVCRVILNSTLTGLDHLEGQDVSILADGLVLDQITVSGGVVTLPASYAYAHVGLPIEADIQTLNAEVPLPDGTLQGRKIKIGNVVFRIINTRGGWVGPDEDNLYNAFDSSINDTFTTLEATDLASGDIVMPLGAGYEDGGSVFYRQSDPLPVTIGQVTPEMAIGGPL